MIERRMPSQEAQDLIDLVRDVSASELATKVDEYEREARFPREVFATLGKTGLLSLPFSEEFGGGAQPYGVYLQALEELASAWLSVGIGVSVHTLSCFALAEYGTQTQQQAWLADLIGGDLLGAYCLSNRNPDRMPQRCRPVQSAMATPTSSMAPRPGSRTAESRTSIARWFVPPTMALAASRVCWCRRKPTE